MKRKIFRALIAVVLVCVLVVNVSPIRARAVAAESVVVTGTGTVLQLLPAAAGTPLWVYVVGLVIVGLGIVGAASAINLASEFVEYSGNSDALLYYNADGTFSYGVDMSFVELVRTFLWEKGFLVNNSTLKLDANVYPPASALAVAEAAAFANLVYYTASGSSYTTWLLVYSNQAPILVQVNNTTTGKGFHVRLQDNSSTGFWLSAGYSQFQQFKGIAYDSSNDILVSSQPFGTSVDPDIVTTVEGAQLGQVAPQEVPMPDGYPEWHANSLPATNTDTEEEITILPIPVNPNNQTIPDNVTQEDIWPGSVADPMPGADTGTDFDGNISETPWETFKKWISEGWNSIIQAIPTADSIAQAIGNVIKSIFVPSEDFLTEKWESIRSEFKFADSITSTGELLVDFLDGLDPEAPVIYIDLGAAEGSYDFGGEVAFIDLRWYERYKPTMDLIISAFLWLAFVWRLILKLPGIISGMPGEFVLMNLPANTTLPGIGSGEKRKEITSGGSGLRWLDK